MAAPTPTWPGSPRPRSPRSPTTIALDRRTAGGDPLNLPAQLTRLFGREAESAQLEDVLARTRLVTLTGAPGCGKSRLSLELGSRLTSRFRDGVWLTELAPLADPALTAGAVGMALGVGEQPGGPMAATLADALAGRELLLILDNCEQVVEAVAELAGHLIGRCPSVRILATTRVPLGLPSEQVWTLPPLTPEPAVELFIDRARLVSREFPVDDAGRSAIEQICRRLDGLPLAIELAAASTRVLSAGQIADRLEQELDLPGRGAPTASPWRRTMEATVDWSCRLLPDSDQRLFERLSVFAGGFDLPAAEAVAGDGGDVLVGLTTLVDHSLVLARPASGEPMRYRLLEPVRQSGGDDRGLVWALIFLGIARYTADDLAGGDAHIRHALSVNRGVGSMAATAYASLYLSHAAGMAGDVIAQRAHLTGAVAALRGMGGVVEEPDWLWAGASLAAAEGRVRSALRVAGGAEALSRRSGSHLNESIMSALRPRLDDARRELGPAVADRLAAVGSRMTVDQLMAEAIADQEAGGDDPLSPREREVLRLVAQGLTNAEVAAALFISTRTVESHLDHIRQKVGHDSRNQLMAWALRESLDSQIP